MASMLATRDGAGRPGQRRFTLSATATRSLLDSIASRLDESRELSRYMTGLLIFLGLLGTFWGLLKTVSSVSDVIQGMSIGTGDLNQMFEQFKTGLAGPLAGMGTAFSASLFGLSGALVLGFLDLTAGQAQNRFFNELEEWLAGLDPAFLRLHLGRRRLRPGLCPGPAGADRGEHGRAAVHPGPRRGKPRQANQAVMTLSERMGSFTDTMRANQQLMLRIAETQSALGPALQRMAERKPDGGFDDVTRGHLRNIEIYLQRLLTETEQGRVQSTTELRNDLRLLTRTIAALAEEQR